jgi:hypothetical protein
MLHISTGLIGQSIVPNANDTGPKHRAVSSLRSSPDRESSGTSTPPFELLSPTVMKVPLYLTDRQDRMVRNLNDALPEMERIVSWFPWAFNSHATLIMRWGYPSARQAWESRADGSGITKSFPRKRRPGVFCERSRGGYWMRHEGANLPILTGY